MRIAIISGLRRNEGREVAMTFVQFTLKASKWLIRLIYYI